MGECFGTSTKTEVDIFAAQMPKSVEMVITILQKQKLIYLLPKCPKIIKEVFSSFNVYLFMLMFRTQCLRQCAGRTLLMPRTF